MSEIPLDRPRATNPSPLAQAWPSLLVGFISSVGVSLVGIVLRLLANVPFPAEKLYNIVTYWLGTPAMFQLVHRLLGFGQGGKVAAFGGVLLAWLGGLTLLGLASPVIASAVVLVVSFALLLSVGPVWAILHAAVYFGIRYALQPVRDQEGKRGTLQTLGWGSLAVFGAGAFGIVRPLFDNAPKVSPTDVAKGNLPSGITSVDDFYYVSINNEALDPKVNGANWNLEVAGLVKNPQSFRLDALRSDFTPKDLEFTFSCISNPVGGELIGNALWRGVSFKDLVNKVGVQPGAKWVIVEAADGFYESLPLADMLEDDVMLAYDMNGKPLNNKHGFPLRTIIPGRYGMKQPRWITKITFSAEEKPGYWANRGWSRTAYVMTMSRIDFPSDGKSFKAGEVLDMRGVAFGGLKPITRVEVSTDDGQTWNEAKLTAPRSKHAWTLWQLPWTARAGRHTVIVRAYANGVLQNTEERDSLPEAASGLHKLFIDVT
jgi:DMSO/TMAO reductase YedYZ molybdopterin-dependent catalytic subunit